ncbi:glycosyltransferase family 87 protein [Corynebacterium coyleae]|uniref:glycosyltransferase family 87 protein n=1 Tax=Corynebacterium coyleae TaxID=53374 RepID=UPI0025516AE6|nr:glycosyltransferase 87 family protein [Corynebacterium coyleae]MDK8664664.1 glycosyltransferase 87 family protein [Corynebacterium coyleae]MDK8707770.1 glycosyltransferase 87 family protein [Corynebacterium coyleae]MDK8734619.1 glycosyltransferase 87 family protein [Corynebacterium coyleae]MDK8893814.1 glycosyltransferase 87 family protein [Corynebacterium coyleae]
MSQTDQTTVTWPDPADRVQPGKTEPVARGWVNYLGGPMGRFAQIGRARFWTPLRAIIAVAYIFLSFGALQKSRCAGGKLDDNGIMQLNWDGNRQFVAACYNDIIPLYGARGLDQPGFVYAYSWVEDDLTRYMEYPVLAGLFQQLSAWIARGTYFLTDSFLPESGWYFYVTALLMSIIWVITIRMVAELAGNRIWDTLLVAGSPLLIVHAFTNWDIPSIFFAVAAMLAARNRKWWLAGVLVGLGTAFKLWPLFILGAYLTVAIRKRDLVPFFKMVGATAITWIAVNAPVYLRYPDAWSEFNRLNTDRGWEWTTIYAVLSREFGWAGFDSGEGAPVILNAVTLILFLLGCLFVLILGLRAPQTPRIAELIVLIVGFFLLFNKVWSPQYSLWFVVPAVLALPYWRLLLSWMVADMMVWPVLMWHMMGDDNMGVPGWFLDIFILARDAFIVAVMVLVVKQMLGKRPDKVREAHNGHDPLMSLPAQWKEPVLIDEPTPEPVKPAEAEAEAVSTQP